MLNGLISCNVLLCNDFRQNLSAINIIDLVWGPAWFILLIFQSNFMKPLNRKSITLSMRVLKLISQFYIEGFAHLPRWGKQVWLVILIKLFIMFFILKIFFFPNFLKTNFKNDQERSKHVLENLTNINQ